MKLNTEAGSSPCGTSGYEDEALAQVGGCNVKTLPDQTASESALALAADSDHTQAAANACCAFPEIATQLGRLVAAIEQQTAMQQRKGQEFNSLLRSALASIDSLIWWVAHKAATGRKTKTGGRT